LIDSGCADHLVRNSADPRVERQSDHSFRVPTAYDAHGVAALIAACPPLDPNSLYCNLLQCTHFARTCVLAERDGAIEGWISAYRPPGDSSTLFVWQVAVHEDARGSGLGIAMLDGLLGRADLSGVRRLSTTVTPSNDASRRMFAKFAAHRSAELQVEPWFDGAAHFGGSHESEELISIGPL